MRDQFTTIPSGTPARTGEEVTSVWVDPQWAIERWVVGLGSDQSEWDVVGEPFWRLIGDQLGDAEPVFRSAMADRVSVELDLGEPDPGDRLVVRLTPAAAGAMIQFRLAAAAIPSVESDESRGIFPTATPLEIDGQVPIWARSPLIEPGETIGATDLHRRVVQRLVEQGGFRRVALSVLMADRLLVAQYAGYVLIDVLRPVTDPGPGVAVLAGEAVRVVAGSGAGMLAEDSAVAVHVPFRSGEAGPVSGVITVEWPADLPATECDTAALVAMAAQLSRALESQVSEPAASAQDVALADADRPTRADHGMGPDEAGSASRGGSTGDAGEGDGVSESDPSLGPGHVEWSGLGRSGRLEALVTRQWDGPSGRWPLSGLSDRIEELSGYSAEALVSEPGLWLAAVHADDRSQAMMGQSLAPEVGQRSQTAYRFRRADGAWRLFQEEAVVFRDSVGNLINALLVSDVTDDQRTVQLLHESETRYRYLVDDLPGVVAYIREYDPRFEMLRTSYISAEIESLTGITPDVWIRENIAIISLVHPDDRERVETARHAVLGKLSDFSHEYRIIRPDGQIRWVRNRVRHIARMSDDPGHGERWHGVMIDITTQREAEIALAEREAEYRLLVEQLPSATLFTQQIHRTTGERTTTYVSPQVTALTGFDLVDPQRPDPPFLSLVHPDDRDLVLASMPGPGTTSARLSVDFRIIHRSGRTRWMRSMTHREGDDPDAPLITWRGIMIDITDQRVAEEAARAEDVRLRAVVEQGSEIVLIVDDRWAISFASPAIETILGYRLDQVRDLTVSRVIHPENLPEVREVFGRLRHVPGGRVTAMRTRARHFTGSWRWIELSAVNKLDVPAIGGIVVTGRDVTDQVLAEESLRFRETLFGTLVEHSADYIMVVQPDMQISYASPSAQGLIARDEVLTSWPMPWPDRPGATTIRPRLEQIFKELGEQPGATVRVEERLQHTSGEIRWVSATVTNHLETPGIQGFVINAHDVTESREAQQQLRDSEERFRALFRYAPDIVMVLDPDGFVQYASPSVEIALGDSINRFMDRDAQLNFHPDDNGMAIEQFDRALEHPSEGVSFEARVRHQSGAWLWWEITLTNLLTHPSVGGLVLNARDVTWRKDAEAMLRESEERFRSLLQHGSDLTILVSERGVVTFVTPSSQRILGYEPGDMVGKVDFEWISRSDRVRFDALLVESQRHAEPVGPIVVSFRHADGTMRDLQIIATSLLGDRSVRGIVINAHDVTERRTLEQQLIHQASHDALTGLPNRSLFHQRLDEARERSVANGTSFAVILLDLDDLKIINYTLGHAAGDQVLRTIGDRLRSIARDDDMVARMGGDEFTIVIEELADVSSATTFADRVISRLREPISLGGHDVLISPCLGIAIGRPDDAADNDLLREADIAMYEAKARGKGQRVVYDDSVNSQALARMQTQDDLRDAITGRKLQVHYQPQIELVTGRIIEFEALVRWEHPTRGMISPAEILPVAEETGMIIPLGQFVISEACRAARGWNVRRQATGLEPLVIGVNLSARQFLHPTLIEDVTAALAESGLEPRLLRLEITESVALNDLAATIETMRALRELGVSLAIDDFGTGYSGLNYLSETPIDTIKIDGSFIDGLGSESSDTAMIHAVMAYATTLGLDVCAEGIESAEQVRQLRAVGCHRGQGFYFSGPLPEETVTAMLETDALWSLGYWDSGSYVLEAGD